jgi:hypothetical protein
VGYWPVQNGYTDNLQQTVVTTTQGDLIASAPDLASSKQVIQLSSIIYAANKGSQPLSAFLQTNVAHGKKFLSGTPADQSIEFTVGAANNPVHPRDPRYLFMTAQPYASSSYGLLQFSLLAFSQGSQQVKLNSIFNPGYAQTCPAAAQPCAPYGNTPLYQLLTQPQTNFNLGAAFHRQSYEAFPANTFCDGTNSCNEVK